MRAQDQIHGQEQSGLVRSRSFLALLVINPRAEMDPQARFSTQSAFNQPPHPPKVAAYSEDDTNRSISLNLLEKLPVTGKT